MTLSSLFPMCFELTLNFLDMINQELPFNYQEPFDVEPPCEENLRRDEFHRLLTSLEDKFGIDNVKPLRKRHGQHNRRLLVLEDELPF